MLYTLPFCGRSKITSAYGNRTLNGKKEFHPGWDVVGVDDTDVCAACPGTVKSSTMITNRSDLTWQWGNYVKLRDGLQQDLFACHMNSRAVDVGSTVDTGDKLGVMGNTGYSFGAHTHWEARTAAGDTVCPGELFGLPNAAGVTWDREKMDELCVGYLECTVDQYRWRLGPGTSYGLYQPTNINKSLYCRKGVTYRVYGEKKVGAVTWYQITPPAACVTGSAPECWVSGECGKYEAKKPQKPEVQEPPELEKPEPNSVDWNSEGNDFVITASKGDRPALREVCERLALPVKNA